MADELERKIYEEICVHDGIKARQIAKEVGAARPDVNRLLYASPFMRELCYCGRDFCWHGLIRQMRPHIGLADFCGYCGLVSEFLDLPEEEWLAELREGCRRIGRNLNDTRGLIHSFKDCRMTMQSLFSDMDGFYKPDWEIAFSRWNSR